MAQASDEKTEIRRLTRFLRPLTFFQVFLGYGATLGHLGFLVVLCHVLGAAFPSPSHPSPLPGSLGLPVGIGAMLALVFFRAALTAMEGPVGERAASRARGFYRTRLRAAGLAEPGPGGTPGSVFSTLYQDAVESLTAWVARYLPAPLMAALVPVTVLVLAFWVDPLTGLTLLVCGPLVPIFMILIGRLTRERSDRQLDALTGLSARLGELIRGLPTLVPLGRTDWARGELIRDTRRHAKTTLEVLATAFLSALVLEWLTTLSTAIVAVECGLRLLNGHMGFESALLAILLAPEFFGPLRQLGLRFHAAQDGRAAVGRILHYELFVSETQTHFPKGQEKIDTKSMTSTARQEVEIAVRKVDTKPTASKGPGTTGETNKARATGPSPSSTDPVCVGGMVPPSSHPLHLRVSHLAFDWGTTPLLREVNLAVDTGSITAFVGPSGCGKSTLSRVLMKLETPGGRVRHGEMIVNGAPLGGIDDSAWRSCITWLPQRPRIFAGSVREHFTRFTPDATDEAIRHALDLAGLSPWLRQLGGGLEERVGEEGHRLSGGERQRLALARCLLHERPLLILDEFTAHLDPELEEELLARLAPLFPRRAVIVISHRPRTLALADRRLVWDKGPMPIWEGPSP